MEFKDKVVVMTGAAGNLGNVAARRFAEAGAKLVLVDVKPDRLLESYGDLRDDYGAILIGNTDVTDPRAINKLVDLVTEEVGRIDVLVNIAGGYRSDGLVHETSPDTFDFLMNLNAKSVFLMAGGFTPHMIEQGYGKIINIAASSGLHAKSRNGAYAASKSAVIRLTESLSAGLRDHGINVNCVLPSTIDTPGNREAMPNADFEKWVSPEAMSDVLLFLASDASRAIHGAAIPVYGRVNV